MTPYLRYRAWWPDPLHPRD